MHVLVIVVCTCSTVRTYNNNTSEEGKNSRTRELGLLAHIMRINKKPTLSDHMAKNKTELGNC